MKRTTGFKILLSVVFLILLVQVASAEGTRVWQLTAQGTSTGCTSHTPCQQSGPNPLCGIYICKSFTMYSPDMYVTQSGNTLTASGVDSNGNAYSLDGFIVENSVTFSIKGNGITPGIGPATTFYTGSLNDNVIIGTFSGSASWTYDDGNGNMISETAIWTGDFSATIIPPDASFTYLPTNPTTINTVTFAPTIVDTTPNIIDYFPQGCPQRHFYQTGVIYLPGQGEYLCPLAASGSNL